MLILIIVNLYVSVVFGYGLILCVGIDNVINLRLVFKLLLFSWEELLCSVCVGLEGCW